MLETHGRHLLHITDVSLEGDEIFVRCDHWDEGTRVHVFDTRYVPRSRPLWLLAPSDEIGPIQMEVRHPESSYHAGREIGDEYRYILERRYTKKYPGNMLRRPGLLLNPWAIDDTDSSLAMGGEAGGMHGGEVRR